MTVIGRELKREGTFPKEIVTCRLGDGSVLRLFCKYGVGQNHEAYGHRGGVAYEAGVYRQVLASMQMTKPTFHGVHTDPASGEIWLVLEYLNESVRVKKSRDPLAMGLAARWIAQFHAANVSRRQNAEMAFLKTYDADYYLGWARRAAHYAGSMSRELSWLSRLCERFEEVAECLLSGPQTVIHGEYYPKNILYSSGEIYPVDWESAAIAAGEIDLASLTDLWPEEIVRDCETQYYQAHPSACTAEYCERKLWAARVYLQFRWLGERPEWNAGDMYHQRLEQLRSAGARLGLI